MSAVVDANGEVRYFGLYFGFVKDNKDPLKLARVRVEVPGLVDESDWAWPVGMAGGSAQNGGWDVPKKGARIAVMFRGGEPDEPVYLHGWYAKPGDIDSPTPIKSASADDAADKIKCYESDRFLIVLDERGGAEELLIKDKKSGDSISMKPSGTTLKVSGDVKVEASTATVEATSVNLGSGTVTPLDGVVTGKYVCPILSLPLAMVGKPSTTVKAKE